MRTSLRMEPAGRFQKDAIHQKVIPVVYSSFMRGWKSFSRLSPMIMGKVESKARGLERRQKKQVAQIPRRIPRKMVDPPDNLLSIPQTRLEQLRWLRILYPKSVDGL
jgi:hypothetical protein